MSEITQKVCITGFPKLWHVKGHNSVGDTLFSCSGSAQHESYFSVESDVTRLAQVIYRQSGSYFQLTVGTQRGLHTQTELTLFMSFVTLYNSLWTYSGEVGASRLVPERKKG